MTDNSKAELSEVVARDPINTEKKEISLDYIIPFEEILLSGSSSLIIDGKERFVHSSSLLELMQKSDTRKALLTSLNVSRGKVSPEEVLRAREQIEYSTTFITLFEFKSLTKHVPRDKDIRVTLKTGRPDESGLPTEFEICSLKEDKVVGFDEIPPEDFVLNKDFERVVELTGRENDTLKFRIKSIEEIRNETAIMPAKL
ncbi:MAG: hypothetical protein HW400_238 [Candidatus Levybacteria bacterium]|nr:hypothetical protein [Candidatus Levybacteria bacterium]